MKYPSIQIRLPGFWESNLAENSPKKTHAAALTRTITRGTFSFVDIYTYIIPVVPHKAVAEVSKRVIVNFRHDYIYIDSYIRT